jgi:glycosyltransferase involved in cell wall biosynthesis
MKILLVQDWLRSGGTERQTVLLANAFAAVGQTATLLTFRPGGALEPTLSPAVTRHVLQPFDTGLDWYASGLGRYVARSSPDIVLCMGRMANCYGSRIVQATHGQRPRPAVVGTMRTGKNLPWLFRRSLRRVHHVVANSAAAKSVLVNRHGLSADKVTVIYNSLVFSPAPGAQRNEHLRAAHGATPSTTVLLNVAMFRPEKNQRTLVELAAALPADFDWQLWLAGDGPARPACAALARKLGLADRVKFLGFQADSSPLYAAADVAVHASRSESLSNFVIEAQAHGLPAVACEAQGMEECIVPEVTGTVVPQGRPDAFRAAIMKFAALDVARRRQAADFARTTFDPQRQIRAYLDLFSTLPSDKPAPPTP